MSVMTRKTVDGAVTKAADARTRTFCITTGRVDRDNDVVSPDGWDFAEWLRNPVILPSHQYGAWPIGRGSAPRRRGNGWYSDFTFAATPEGDTVLALIDDGFLHACSVGFKPLEYSRDVERGGMNFLRQELLEVSVCAVPANPDALVQRAQQLGLSAAVVRKMFGARAADDDAVVLRLVDDPADEPLHLIDDDEADEDVVVDAAEVAAIVKHTIRESLTESIRAIPATVKQELQRRRGRISEADPLADQTVILHRQRKLYGDW